MTRNEMTNRQSVIGGLQFTSTAEHGALLKEIAIALLEVAKKVGDIVEAIDRNAPG